MGNQHVETWERLSKKAIDEWGRDVVLTYTATANCSSCAWDPINKSGTNSFCDTCNGLFYFDSAQTLSFKGVIKTFVGKLSHADYELNKFGYVPGHDARLTCWLSDVLINTDSASGPSYLDQDLYMKLEADGSKYNVLSTQRVGADENLKVIVATLKGKQ